MEYPKEESEQEDSFWTAQFHKEDQEKVGYNGFLIPAPDQDTALRLAQIHAGNEQGNPQIKKTSVHKAHAYDIVHSDIVQTSFENVMYVTIESVDGEIPTEELKNY